MLAKFIVAFPLLVAVAYAARTTGSTTCVDLYTEAKLSPNFNETIAHAVHSMTVDGLKIFHAHASEDNKVPTVNQNVSARNLVLNHAPHVAIGSDFHGRTMNTIDRILSQLGKSDDGLGKHWSPVERVVHTFHM